MDIEYEVKIVPINTNHGAEVQKLQNEGWELMPGVVPVGVYHVIRNKNRPPKAQETGGFGQMIIDDSKVMLLGPDGKPKQ